MNSFPCVLVCLALFADASVSWSYGGATDRAARVHRMPLERVHRSDTSADELRAIFATAGSDNRPDMSGALRGERGEVTPVGEATEMAAALVNNFSMSDGLPLPVSLAQYRASVENGFEMFYILKVKLGTPGTYSRMVIDTGSSDAWVRQGEYDPANSSTSCSDGAVRLVHLAYAKGFVDGNETADTICIGSLCVQNGTLVVVSREGDIGDGTYFDGLIGLAFPGLSKTHGPTLLQTLRDSGGQFEHLAFGLSLGYDDGSYLTIGDRSDVLAEAQRTYGENSVSLPVEKVMRPGVASPMHGYWLVKMDLGVRMQAGLVEMSKFGVFDSGTSFMALPASDYAIVMGALLGVGIAQCQNLKGVLVCPCDMPMQSMTLAFSDGKKRLEVELGSDELMLPVGMASSGGQSFLVCRLALMQINALPFWLLGDTLLRHLYAVHDVSAGVLTLYPSEASSAKVISDEAGVPISFLHIAALVSLGLGVLGILWVCKFGRASARSFGPKADDYSRL